MIRGAAVIAQDPPALGELAAQLLLHRMGDPHGSPEVVEVPTNMLTRGSGEIRPARTGEIPVPQAHPGPRAADGSDA